MQVQADARKRLASRFRWILVSLAFIALGVTVALLVLAEATDYHILNDSVFRLLDNALLFLFPVIFFAEGIYLILFGREQIEWSRDMHRRGRWYSRLFSQKYNTPGWVRGMGWFWVVYGNLFFALNLWTALVLR